MATLHFIPVPSELLQSTHNDNRDIPSAYFHSSWIVRWLFTRRLRQAAKKMRHLKNRKTCVDVGCGGGAFLPTLAKAFENVIGIDKDIEPATIVKNKLLLSNVELMQGDLYEIKIPTQSIDCIVAISVIEHLKDQHTAIGLFSEWMAPKALLVISVPSETYLYQIGRWMFNFIRPHDHHEPQCLLPLLKQHFNEVTRESWPSSNPMFAYFYLYTARKNGTKDVM